MDPSPRLFRLPCDTAPQEKVNIRCTVITCNHEENVMEETLRTSHTVKSLSSLNTPNKATKK